MARETQPVHSRLMSVLKADISTLNFYQFCQAIERTVPDRQPLGSTDNPADDVIRFRPHPGMGFPIGELKTMETDSRHPDRPLTARTTFMGLYGVDSPLPTAYLNDIAQHREGHDAVEAFLDMFNHRIFTQFYRIWRKYSYPATFAAGGSDQTSQCLLGLIGLGIPGSQQQITTPASRFLALLSVMRLPTRTAEGVSALVTLLAPQTRVVVTPSCPRQIHLMQPAGFSDSQPISLSQRTVLGRIGTDINSQLLLALHTDCPEEARGWLPGGQLQTDLLVLLRVYLGWRYRARLQLTLQTRILPVPVLGSDKPVQLGLTGVLGLKAEDNRGAVPDKMTVDLGDYQGLPPNNHQNTGGHNVNYAFI
ncbi:type VI secretion system baseplate subunit TssG [Photorhabdus temperata subsp. temperata]|uniref:Type VI secretion protein, VC_A0111 family n=1 Tax=Photorhabdus temperata subsp. temperata Meg1 TaxID=1393735 RepID=A0A081RZL9_PHOTE|nr:type VI secretion system baseplate subunit TssG [Photorhabdus temperata]KER04122.1 type VI secretion protein, VC_A0111 family [Photorhabdus temperata subsp. temperata Meg1]